MDCGRGRNLGGGTPERRDHPTQSGSPASSKGEKRIHSKPVTKPIPELTGDSATAENHNQPNLPVTPNKERSSYTLNSRNINETYVGRRSTNTTSPWSAVSPSTKTSSMDSHSSPRATQRPVTFNPSRNWILTQELKIRLLTFPESYGTKDLYEMLRPYGNIMRIEVQKGGRFERTAWVVFQPPPQHLPQPIRLHSIAVKWEIQPSILRNIASPVNPSRSYPELNILSANSIKLGPKDGDLSMITMRTVKSQGTIRVALDLSRKEIDLQFPLKIDDRHLKCRVRLPFALLSTIYKVACDERGQTALVIPFDSPPQFFIQRVEGELMSTGSTHTSFSQNEKVWTEWQTWFRETDVIAEGDRKSVHKLPLMNNKEAAIIDIGRWTSYMLAFDTSVFDSFQYAEFSDALNDHGIQVLGSNSYVFNSGVLPPLWKLLEEELSGTHPHLEAVSDASGFGELIAGKIHLAFPVRYQLEACLSNGYLKEHSITNEFLEKLAAMDSPSAIHILEKVVDKQAIHYNPMDIFKLRLKGTLHKAIPRYCILQRSAVITPTMIHVASPSMETSNRITRKHAADGDRFIRIKFSDEKAEGVLRNLPNDRAAALFDRVSRAMRQGIVVAGRYFEFLAFGNSQFREHGAYFYAPTSSKSADDIRLSLGQFNHIRTVAKFGARLGQCFSTTRAMGVKVKIRTIPDIQRNNHCFTDGVGKISTFLAQMAAQELGLPNAFENPPSLFQFRLGGCKGVLALDPTITGSEVHIRPSQQKFEAEYMGLEIIRSSALATPYFNRQIIQVLSDLGVRDYVFIRRQQEMVNDYEQAMTDESLAIKKLRKHIDMNQSTLVMAGMVLDGFMNSREPFMMSLLSLWRAATIKNLKERARIAIDEGAFVLGCVDETGILKGHHDDLQSKPRTKKADKMKSLPEIFLQIDDVEKKGRKKVIEGVCILARNPSLHPGDVRVVRAVNVPALHHLNNVVVFPQNGDRDLAGMCSGGDLDGDDFMVFWDRELQPELINEIPMDFTPETPMEKDEPITVTDIGDFFVTYMKNDSLGQIAHAHLAQADYSAQGVFSDVCIDLAKLHSQAVDYPKSGIPAQMEKELRPKRWPHFMEKKYIHPGKIYKSRKILGLLYDQVQLVDFKPRWDNPFDKRILGAYDPEPSTMALAAEIKKSYDESLKRLMAKHGIRTEFEAWTVFVLEHNLETGKYKFAEEFGRTIEALKAQFRENCRTAAGVTSGSTMEQAKLYPFVAAMYVVTAQEVEAALEECHSVKMVGGERVPQRPKGPEHMPLMSFPWLFTSELGKIATTYHNAGIEEPMKDLPEIRYPYRGKKHVGEEFQSGLAEVETEGGVTHYGELLKLDFDDTSR